MSRILNIYKKNYCLINLFLLGIFTFFAFSNNYNHDYHLDSGHLIKDNHYVRSLKYIPQYFTDPSTLSSIFREKSNIDYRPVLQITYALNYLISGYNTWSWHLVQILIHLICVFSLYFFCKKIIIDFVKVDDKKSASTISFFVSLIFAIHPYTSGTINYLSARSSLLAAAFYFSSVVIYMYMEDKKSYCMVPLLYGLAIFTKIESLSVLAVYFFYEVLKKSQVNSSNGFLKDTIDSLNVKILKKLAPMLIITVMYGIIRLILFRNSVGLGAFMNIISPLNYFYTQITAYWHYVLSWFAPVNLIADDLTYPIFKSIFDAKVLLAISGWLFVASFLISIYKKAPYIMFITLSALALISPTSSFVPMTEMVNEHRSYMPLAVLSLSWLIPIFIFVLKKINQKSFYKYLYLVSIFLYLSTLLVLTLQRNKVFATSESYYQDIITKAPSTRAYNNYGLTFMKKGQYKEALDLFKKSVELSPNWHIVHTNLGIAYQAMGEPEKALFHFNKAVATDPSFTGNTLIFRGNYFLKNKKYSLALQDFQDSIPLSRVFFDIYKGLATAFSGLGDWEKALNFIKKCYEIDSSKAEIEVKNIALPFWDTPDLALKGIEFYKEFNKIYPKRWWVYHNIGSLYLKINNTTESNKYFLISRELKEKE